MIHDLKYETAVRWSTEPFKQLHRLRNAAVSAVAQQFAATMMGVQNTGILLPAMLSLQSRYSRAAALIESKSTDDDRRDPEFQKKSQSKIHALVDEWEAELHADKEESEAEDNRIFGNIRFLVSLYAQSRDDEPEPILIQGIRALFHSILINSWSAFEVMAGDLWIAAVNNCPNEVARRVYLRQKDSKSIKIADLEEYDFNVAGRIGSLLVTSENIRFNCFNDIKTHFTKAFDDKRYAEIFEAHKKDPANVKALESIRNLLMHRGRIADKKFVDEITGAKHCSSAYVNGLKVGDTFSIDGDVVNIFVKSVCGLGCSLINLTDSNVAELIPQATST